PRPAPPRELVKGSLIESLSVTSRRMEPDPVPVLTVTVYVVPLPVTLVSEAPATPLVVRVKSVRSTPVTLSLKVTVKSTLAALVGLPAARTIDCTTGPGTKVKLAEVVESP